MNINITLKLLIKAFIDSAIDKKAVDLMMKLLLDFGDGISLVVI